MSKQILPKTITYYNVHGQWIEINFKKGLVETQNHLSEITSDNVERVKTIAAEVVKLKRVRLSEIVERLSVSEEKKVRIPHGYKIVKPASANLVEKLNAETKDITRQIELIESIDYSALLESYTNGEADDDD